MKPIHSIVLIALISATSLGHNAMAESKQPRAELPGDAKAGARWSYVDGAFLLKCNNWEVKEVMNNSGLMVNKCGGNTMYVTADERNMVMAVNDKGDTVARFTPFFPGLSFPLFVGKKWSGKYNGQKGYAKFTGEVTCESAAFESVAVKAGKLDAFRIECENKWDAGIIFINGTKKSTSWYAPSVGLVVKSVNEDSEWNMELAGAEWR